MQAKAGEELVRGFAEGGPKKAMEVKFGQARLTGGVLEQNPGGVGGGKEISSATEPSEGIVMKQSRHAEMVLHFCDWNVGLQERRMAGVTPVIPGGFADCSRLSGAYNEVALTIDPPDYPPARTMCAEAVV